MLLLSDLIRPGCSRFDPAMKHVYLLFVQAIIFLGRHLESFPFHRLKERTGLGIAGHNCRLFRLAALQQRFTAANIEGSLNVCRVVAVTAEAFFLQQRQDFQGEELLAFFRHRLLGVQAGSEHHKQRRSGPNST